MPETRDWPKLPTDLVSVITKKFPDLSDFVRVRAVCKTWGSTPLSGCPPQLPWLLEFKNLLPPELEREQRFYCLSSGKTGTICVEESHRGKPFRRPCKGYLLLFHGQCESVRVSLFNPLTRAVISLPFIGIDFIWPVWISANRKTNEFMFVERYFETRETGKLAYHPPESNEWISVEGIFNNCCYMNGMFFSTEDGEDTKVFHVTSKTLLHEIPPPEGEIAIPGGQVLVSVYLVESCEEILRVSWYMDRNKRRVEESVFHIHRLDFQGEKGCPRWIKITNMGDQIIFLEPLNCFSICAKPFAGFRGNCIYFVHHLLLEKPHRYDIETGTVETVPCPFEISRWFIPSLE